VIAYTRRAARDVAQLRTHYEARSFIEAVVNLDAALREAERRIEADPAAGSASPRPYPQLARPARAWIKSGNYWIAYTLTAPPVIVGVFHDSADIPRRI